MHQYLILVHSIKSIETITRTLIRETKMRFSIVCHGTVYVGFSNKSDAHDWACRNLHFEWEIMQMINVEDIHR